MLKKLIVFLFLTTAAPLFAFEILPEFVISDQFKDEYTSSELAGEETLVIVYRNRDALETGKEHYKALKELNSNLSVIRIADLSRVPGIFKGAAVNSLKKSDPENSIYTDTKGNVVALFDVSAGECGFFYYLKNRIVSHKTVNFEDAVQLKSDLLSFAAK